MTRMVDSPMATFRIGEHKTEFRLPSRLVAVQSKSMSNIIRQLKGRFDEQRIIWRNVPIETFMCFYQYVLTGDYKGRMPLARLFSSAGHRPGSGKIKLRLTNSAARPEDEYEALFWDTFVSLYPGFDSSLDDFVDSRPDTCEDLFLCHARVCIFADRYHMTGLFNLAIRKLWTALGNMVFTGNAIPEITALAKYIYSNTTRDKPAHKELRHLVQLYALCYYSRMWISVEFQEFARNSEFVHDAF
ncbi:hypothetical protein ACHAPT_009764 [Fusarium lateritium]